MDRIYVANSTNKLHLYLHPYNMLLCRGNNSIKCRKPGSFPVYINVYDLTSMNEYAYWLGLGVYHSGVQVHGVEYAYGAHEQSTTGIFEGEPKKCEGFTFRKRILIGWTEMNLTEVGRFMEKLGNDYKGTSYNLNSTKVGIEDNKVSNEVEIKTKLRSSSSRFTSSSSFSSSISYND